VSPFYDGGVHPLHAVQLAIRSSPGIKQSRLFQETDGTLDSCERRPSFLKNAVAGRNGIGETIGLCRCLAFRTGASMCKNERMESGQLKTKAFILSFFPTK
jgi:hypothetical protein